ncbi:hypothetical protein RJ55_06910 [Drechmeria coniospora]|nr:hypothetical protein RJ55_06910 [Drechmeria coniospora]
MDGGLEGAAARPAPGPGPGPGPGPRSASTQLQVRQEGRRPLFGSNGSRDPATSTSTSTTKARESPRVDARAGSLAGAAPIRRTKSDSQTAPLGRRGSSSSVASLPSPAAAGTRIPQPNSSTFWRRRPISIHEAWQLAEDEELQANRVKGVDGSPSPAPRTWRATAQDENKLRQQLGRDHLDTKGNANQKQRVQSPVKRGTQQRIAGSATLDRPTEARMRTRASGQPAGQADTNGTDHRPKLVPGIEDVAVPSIEPAARPPLRMSPSKSNKAETRSPEKSYVWQIDDDFTAGDLQISDSPRIKVGSNTPFAHRPPLISGDNKMLTRSPSRRAPQDHAHDGKRDVGQDRERRLTAAVLSGRPRPKQNSKLDEIRAREQALTAAAELQGATTEESRGQSRPKNTKLDEIRRREAEGLSRRAYATARLEEIREQNSMSRSLSPDDLRPAPGREQPRRLASTPGADKSPGSVRSRNTYANGLGLGGEKIPDTPVTIYKGQRATVDASRKSGKETRAETRLADGSANGPPDSYDWLRRLARATSSSPAPEPAASERGQANGETNGGKRGLRPARVENGNGKKVMSANDGARPTVGFVGLAAEDEGRASDSARSKRSSMNSEVDPTDRIEAEMKLFAPQDNYSEPSSVRAPSSPADSDREQPVDATPKPPKTEPSVMATPKVIGAYIETPATARVAKSTEGPGSPDRSAPVFRHPETRPNRKGWGSRSRERDQEREDERDQETASDPGASDGKDDAAAVMVTTRKPRARSLPRRRPPLKNTARLPSVKNDLLELQRKHNIDDSNLDDLEDILAGRKVASPKRQPLSTSGTRDEDENLIRVKGESGRKEEDASDSQLALVSRMSKTLRTGLMGLRTAKEGIARLEDRVALAETRTKSSPDSAVISDSPHRRLDRDSKQDATTLEEHCPDCMTNPRPSTVTYVHIPIPRLYHAVPRFRLTLLGLMLSLSSLWYVLESATCAVYCRPTTCTPAAPCVYSYDDPTFGSALPVKLDQLATGGRGRGLVAWAVEELEDRFADMQDAALGRTIQSLPFEGMSTEQKRRHRRRLRKKGLVRRPSPPSVEQKAKWDAWRRARLAKERARDAREMGYDASDEYDNEGASVGGDERVS